MPQDLHQRTALHGEEHEMKLNAVVQLALTEYRTQAGVSGGSNPTFRRRDVEHPA